MDAEYRALREGAALADLSADLRLLTVRGPDRREFLQGLLTCDVKALKPGASAPACLLTPKGRMIGSLRVYERPGDHLLVCPAASGDKVLEVLRRMAAVSESAVEPLGPAPAVLYLSGPRAPSPPEALDYPALGPAGRLLLVAADRKAEVRQELTRAGAVPVGREALERLRVESGVPADGADMDAETFPLEAGLESSISFTKGCYMGQETVAHIKNRGHLNRRLAGVRLAERLPAGSELYAGEAVVGRLSSVVDSPRLGAPLALALVRVAHAEPGSKLQAGPRRLGAEVVRLPL